MDRPTIIHLLLKLGTQADQVVLDILAKNPNILEQLLKSDKKNLPPIITENFLTPIFQSGDHQTKTSIEDLTQILNYRYNFLRNLLIERKELVNLVSLNKINEKLKEFSVIGIVHELNDTLTLEDSTGFAKFKTDRELVKSIVEDEVIGIVCEQKTGTNEVKQIVYPDIPLRKENSRTESLENCFFISDMHMDSPDFNKTYYKNFVNWVHDQKNLKIFILGGISKNKEDVTRVSSDMPHPTYFCDEDTTKPTTFQLQNVQLLLSDGSFLQYYMQLWKIPVDTTIINLLRKRNLNPILKPASYSNSFLLETIPDIIVFCGIKKPTSTNYKGTTILTNGSFETEPIYWLINLQTRETFKIDFS